MSKVLLVVTFRSYMQFTCDPTEDNLPLIKQRIDIVNAGTLTVEDGHRECFTFSIPCELDLTAAVGQVALNLVNDHVAALIRHIGAVLPDAVIIASAGYPVEEVCDNATS
jgi:hypothetical protein